MNDKILAIIVDDEIDARDGLEMLLNNLLPDVKIVGKATTADEAIRKIVKDKPDLIFLDVELPDRDGFYVAEELERLGSEMTIIFVTAFNQYAIQAIKHAAFDFILKPIDPDELVKAVGRFRNRKEKESLKEKLDRLTFFLHSNHLKFPTQNGFILLNPKEIIYCEAEGNYTKVFLLDEIKEIVTMQIGHIETELNPQIFIRINRTHIINIHYIKYFDKKKKSVIMRTENLLELKVSKTGIKQLINI